jgi:DNA-binding CsgD family transcriptional regulator
MREPSGMAAPLVSLSLVALGAGQPDQAQRLLSATLATERAIDDEDEFQLAIQRFANMAGNEALDVLRSTRPAFPLNNADAEFDQLRDRLRQESPCPHREVVHEGPLTPREMEVVRLLAQGLTNRTIAESLSISQRTVENHVLHILDKLELDSRTAAATWAVREGIA